MWALSIKQPWAFLIASGQKDIENRAWPTKYRGPILIHAGKVPDREFSDRGLPPISYIGYRQTEQTGGIIGIAQLVDCVTESQSPWFFGEYGFVLANARPVPFYPYKGQLGIFQVPEYEMAW